MGGGTVAIHGGTVKATGASNITMGGYSGAGIGGNGVAGDGRVGETCGAVTITGGSVIATGGSGYSGASAGIGGGQGPSGGGGGGNVTISGGTVTARGGSSTDGKQAPGIGGGTSGSAGTFSTGDNGSAGITTTGGIQAGTSGCSCIVDGTVYGEITLPSSQYGKTLTVSENANLIIPNGAALTGSITVESGGTLTVNSGSTVTNSGTITVESDGTLTGGGTINNTGNGKVTGDGSTDGVTIRYEPTVTLTSDKTDNTAGPSQAVTFTATVSGNETAGTPTGSVQFKDDSTDLGEAQNLDNNGKATYTGTLSEGEHSITAVYTPAADSAYTGKTSSALTITVSAAVKSISVETQPKLSYQTGDTLDLSGLVITVHYEGSGQTSTLNWGDPTLTASLANGTELKASEHNNQTITITYDPGDGTETFDTTLTLTVSKAPQTGFAFTESSITKTYGEGTFTVKAEGGPGTGAVTYAVTAGTDVISIEGNTATILKAGTATITATKAADDKYSAATATLEVTVDPAPLTVTGVTAEGRAYDGSKTVEITDVTLGGVKDGDEVGVDASSLTGILSSADAGTYTKLTLTGTVNLTGAAAGNYTLSLSTEGMTVTNVNDGSGVAITQAASSISIVDTYTPSKTYDGQPLAVPTAKELELSSVVYSDVSFTWYEGTSPDGAKLDSAPADAGTYYLVASIPASDNTSAASATSRAITISPDEISIQSATLAAKTYDGTDAATVESVTFTGADVLPGEGDYTVTAIYNDADANVSQSGTVTVTLTSGNFTFANGEKVDSYTSATGTIRPLPVVLKWDYTAEFTYDGNEKTVTAAIQNAVDGDTVTLNHTNNSQTARGEYTATVTLTGTDADNYTTEGGTNTSLTWRIAGCPLPGLK